MSPTKGATKGTTGAAYPDFHPWFHAGALLTDRAIFCSMVSVFGLNVDQRGTPPTPRSLPPQYAYTFLRTPLALLPRPPPLPDLLHPLRLPSPRIRRDSRRQPLDTKWCIMHMRHKHFTLTSLRLGICEQRLCCRCELLLRLRRLTGRREGRRSRSSSLRRVAGRCGLRCSG